MAKNARFLESIIEHMDNAEKYRPMTTSKLITVLTHYRDTLCSWPDLSKLAPYREVPTCKLHMAWMCQECLTNFIPNGRIEKAMRWLGYVQGVMVARGLITLSKIMAHNRTVDKEMKDASEDQQKAGDQSRPEECTGHARRQETGGSDLEGSM